MSEAERIDLVDRAPLTEKVDLYIPPKRGDLQ